MTSNNMLICHFRMQNLWDGALGVSFATVSRWENAHVKPSKLAKAQFDAFCNKMMRQGRLTLSGGKNE